MKGQTVHLPKRAWRLGLFFIGILLAGGVLLMYKGNDAVAQGIANKDGILTAEQVKVSFQSVSGKMVNEAVQESKELQVRLQQLEVQKDRLTLRAPEDGKVLKLLAKQGEIVQADTPVILLESKRQYYDIYVSEKQAVHLHEGQALAGVAVSDGQPIAGTIRFITQAPGVADLKETREKGQADLTAFQIRIYTDPGQAVRPGQTIEVTDHELPET